MIGRRSIAMAAVLALAGCGGGGNGDADTSVDTTGDTAVDTSPDTGADTSPDTAADPDVVGDDVAADTTGDGDEDAGDAGDATDSTDANDASDSTTEPDAGCLPLEVAFQPDSFDAWANCFMGIGTSAFFTLVLTNPSLGCDITGVSVVSGSLRRTSDDSVVFTFGALASTTSFSGNVPAAGFATSGYSASDSSVDGSSLDGLDVYVRVNVSSSTGTVPARSPDAALGCVY